MRFLMSTYLDQEMTISFVTYAIFLNSFIFGIATSSHFSKVTFFNTRVTFSERLFLQSSCFLRSSFFRTVTFSQHFIFRSETSTEKPYLENRKFFSVVASRTSYLQKISTEKLLFRGRFFCTALTFQKSNTPHYLLFL